MTDSTDTNKERLLCRQLKDIINQAESLKFSSNYNSELVTFSKYSDELKKYIINHVNENEVLEITKEIPIINVKRIRRKYWYHYLIFPWYLSLVYNESLIREDTIMDVESIRQKYSLIHQHICKENYSNKT